MFISPIGELKITSATSPSGLAIITFLPRPMIREDSLEMSFSGLKTAVANSLRNQAKVDDGFRNVMAYELEQAISDVLIKKTILALKEYSPTCLLVGGGVVANTVFRKNLNQMSDELGIPVYYPPLEYCSDNAVMIGAVGLLTQQFINPVSLRADPSLAF